MRLSGAIFGATLLLLAEANPQGINFGGSNSKEKEEEIANRNYGQQQSSPQIQQHQSQQQCCCIPEQQQCLQNQPLTQGDDLVGEVGASTKTSPEKKLKLISNAGSDQREDCEPTRIRPADFELRAWSEDLLLRRSTTGGEWSQ